MRVLYRLEDVQEPRDVGIHVRVRMLDGVANPRLRSQMDDTLGPVLVVCRLPGGAVGNVDLLEGEPAQRA